MSYRKFLYQLCLLPFYSSFTLFSNINPTSAQITPNGARTVVNSQGNQINITGGTQTGANLFHSFRDFNINSAQIANFLSDPQTQNILARINGGNPSLINGLLQVTGGNSNLFLMNPAGIVFGQGASLNVPASFTATTANQIGFGNNQNFSAIGNNNYAALIGNPDSFLFTTNQAGSIVNAGNLAVGTGQNLSLIAGNTINTGRLTAPGGEIQVLAVPGTNRVRLSQPGQVLSLEIVAPVDGTLRGVDLPTLLTGNDLPGIQVNPTGQVQVAGTSLPNQQGIAVASGQIDVSSATGNGGVVQVMGDRVAALNSRINANGATGGGVVRLGGEYLGGINTGIAPALRFNSQRTVVDRNSLIRANATVTGEGGRVIVWADHNTGYFGRILGRGATGRGAFVEISGRENLAFDGRVEIPGANGLLGSLLLDPLNVVIGAATTNDTEIADGIIGAGEAPGVTWFISAGALAAIPAATAINIAATNNIDFQTNVTFTGGAGAAPITFTAGNITASTATQLNTRGRNITMNAGSIIAPNLNINTRPIVATDPIGNITLSASNGNLSIRNLETGNVSGSTIPGGNIILTSMGGGISSGFIFSASNSSSGSNAGAVTLTSTGGGITVNGSIDSYANTGASGGAINLTSAGGSIAVNSSIFSSGSGGGNTSGSITIDAGTDPTTGNLVRLNGNNTAGTCINITICSAGQGGATNGNVTIRHNGGTTTPFIIGNAATNGTAAVINAGTGNIINPTFPVPVPPDTFTRGIIQIITTLPPVVMPPVTVLSPFQNPEPPQTPPPVIVGTPPEPEPVVEIPLPLPSPSPTPLPSPSPLPTPPPVPVPTPSPSPIPSPIPSPTPIPDPSLRTTLSGVNTNSQLPLITSEPLSGSLTLITNPTNAEISPRLGSLEESFQSEFQQYLGITSQLNAPQTLQEIQVRLNRITETTGVKPALMYVFFAPEGNGNLNTIKLASQTNRITSDTDTLEVVVITGTGNPVRIRLPGTTRRQVLEVANNFRSEVTNFRSVRGFFMPAQQMYKWLLEPLEAELQKQGIDNLVFLMDSGLRSIPLAAMHDGKGFIIERYSVSLMPSLSLTPLDYKPLGGSEVLAMGATTFGNSGLSSLPAVSLELNTVSQLWAGSEFLNDRFTLNNLIQQRQDRPFRMIHLATHGVFNPGDRSNSYIQLWDQRLGLHQLDQLNWGNPPVDLLVLSACQTALGDKDAELGFAGLAINAGVRSALASLWEVNDAATLGLMTNFYQQLQVTTTKAETLRQAQLAMLRGEVRLEGGNLVTPKGMIPLTEELRSLGNLRLSHPYYWSAFTIVGNPW